MKNCKQCQSQFEVSEKESRLCDQLGVPVPDLCRLCRIQNLMAFRNEWRLYRRPCDFTGDEILSAYPPESPFTIYKNEVWWGDKWDALSCGRDFDFTRPFFEQFSQLQKEVPREGTTVFNSENCDYNSHIRESRNCYLNSLVYQCEDLYYSYWCVHDKDVFDCFFVNESTLCYNCISLDNGYNCVMTEESSNCSDCYFSCQLRGCKHCIYCTNLADKDYHILNKPCTKEEFEKMKTEILNGSRSRWEETMDYYLHLRKETPQRYVKMLNTENCTGDHLYNCRNCDNCYEGFNSEECVNSVSLADAMSVHSCYSAGWPDCPGPAYMSLVSRACRNIAYCNYTWFSGDMFYCDSNNACDHCFGCIGLQHKKYCILNKQYTKEKYEQLIPKIIAHMKKTGEWGSFFPKSVYPCAYNESAAADFFPLEKKEAEKRGFKWRDEEEKTYQPATVTDIPDNIKDIPDDFTQEILACAQCGKNYKIIKQELKFYRRMNLPVPLTCSMCRHKTRFSLRNPLRLFDRKCAKCHAEIRSTYAPDRPEKVYCEECYLKEVY